VNKKSLQTELSENLPAGLVSTRQQITSHSSESSPGAVPDATETSLQD
jgi:hypothetical protein